MIQDPKNRSLLISVGLHLFIIGCLIFSFEKTRTLLPQAAAPESNKPIVEAVMVDQKEVQKEVQRLANIEKAKKERERAREKARQEARQREILEKKQKEAELKKQAEAEQLAKVAREKEEQAEKERKEKQEKQEKIAKAEKEKREKQEKQERAEKEAREKQAREEAIAQQKKIEAERKAKEAIISAQVSSRARSEYQALIRSILHQNWTKPTGFDLSGLSCVVLVDLLPTGEVTRVMITRSSGNFTFDRSTEVAVYKSSPLPMPQDPGLAQEARQFEFKFYPEAV